MEIINTIFRLGVILAIFGFIWGLFQIAVAILSGGQSRSLLAHYGLKAIQYLFLVQVTFLFCFQTDSDLSLSQNSILITALILLFYFVSKLQRNQQKGRLFGFIQNGQKPTSIAFSLYAEIGLVVLALGYFIACIYFPYLGINAISIWFKESIVSIENAAFFGFIFKIIGFFFLLSVFGKIVQSILLLISPKLENSQNNIGSNDDQSKYDDFEDITED